MSTIVSHSPLSISETVRVEAWFQRTPIGLWGIECSRRAHVTPKGQVVTRIRLEFDVIYPGTLYSLLDQLLEASVLRNNTALTSCDRQTVQRETDCRQAGDSLR